MIATIEADRYVTITNCNHCVGSVCIIKCKSHTHALELLNAIMANAANVNVSITTNNNK